MKFISTTDILVVTYTNFDELIVEFCYRWNDYVFMKLAPNVDMRTL
jgi:hypothetical protein